MLERYPARRPWLAVTFLVLFVATSSAPTHAEERHDPILGDLVYQNDFEHPGDLADWLLEGPGSVGWLPSTMVLRPDAQQAVFRKWEEVGRRPLHGSTEYYQVVREQIAGANPEMVARLTDQSGKFVGGHIVCWNKAVLLEDNYCLEYDFKPLSPIGLAILFFSARGAQGQDIFSSDLAPRDGVFRSYTHGDIDSYHISYWANNAAAGIRHSSNLRKNSGFSLMASAQDPTVTGLDYSEPAFTYRKYRVQLVKRGGKILFSIDDSLVLSFDDGRLSQALNEGAEANDQRKEVESQRTDTGKVLGGGRFGLRQMVGLAAQYSRFRVYRLSP